MPTPIPSAADTRRYRRRTGPSELGQAISASDAFRTFADDILETGDPRLALERAFRWGYRTKDGEHVAGLQEHLQTLRNQRDRLLRQAERVDFLDALAPELDRLDALDQAETGEVSGEAVDRSVLDRLMERFEQGYRSDASQSGLDGLLRQMQEAVRQPPDGSAFRSSADPGGAGRAASAFGAMRSSRTARADQLRRMLFHGGAEEESNADPEGWRRTPEPAVASAFLDLEVLSELERVEEALARLESIGGIMELSDLSVAEGDLADDSLEAWLSGWSQAARSVTTGGPTRQIDLPPDVISAIGRDLLKGLFRTLASPVSGEHESHQRGNAGDFAESVVEWEPGKPLDLHLVATVSNAVRKGGQVGAGRVSLRPDDFVVVERTATTSVSTVLAIDRSRSMGQSGAWTAAKKVGLAMHELIRQAYPRDSLRLLTFSSTAETVDINDLPLMHWDRYEHGTHLQAALELARMQLRRSRGGTRQVVVITDGEPTLARVGGEEVFASPPTPEVLNATMAEVIRCTRENVTINIVMLGGDARSTFAEQVARVNRGKMFVATRESLGSFILRDYVSR